jgi:transposase
MGMAQLVVTAVLVEGRSKAEVARTYGVSRRWVITLVQRTAEAAVGHPGRPDGRVDEPRRQLLCRVEQVACVRHRSAEPPGAAAERRLTEA